jgi:15-cis-phytoene desaturase
MAFIDGNQTERLCEPMQQYIEERGGQVLLNQPLASVLASPFLQELPKTMALLMRDGDGERERELFISLYISFCCWLFGRYYYFHGGFYLF